MPHKDIPDMLGRVLSGTKYGESATQPRSNSHTRLQVQLHACIRNPGHFAAWRRTDKAAG